MKIQMGVVLGFLCGSLLAHAQEVAPATAQGFTPEKLTQSYNLRVRPVFEAKCMDCHSARTVYPAYYKIPGIKQFIDHDIKEARRRLDFTNGFPIDEKVLMVRNLQDLRSEIDEGEMPPFMYRLMHSGTKVTEKERSEILAWIDEMLAGLGSL